MLFTPRRLAVSVSALLWLLTAGSAPSSPAASRHVSPGYAGATIAPSSLPPAPFSHGVRVVDAAVVLRRAAARQRGGASAAAIRDAGFFFAPTPAPALRLPRLLGVALAGADSLTAVGSRGAVAAAYGLPLFQMKPGYSSLWRQYRRVHASASARPYARQRRWTRYFASLGRRSGLVATLSLSLSVFAVLQRGRLVRDAATAVAGGSVYLNGRRVRDAHRQLYVGDCVQLAHAVAVLGWAASTRVASRRWHRRILAWCLGGAAAGGGSAWGGGLERRPGLRRWLADSGCGNADVPAHLEVDYLAQTIFLLYAPAAHRGVDLPLAAAPAFASRLYNWKYTN